MHLHIYALSIILVGENIYACMCLKYTPLFQNKAHHRSLENAQRTKPQEKKILPFDCGGLSCRRLCYRVVVIGDGVVQYL